MEVIKAIHVSRNTNYFAGITSNCSWHVIKRKPHPLIDASLHVLPETKVDSCPLSAIKINLTCKIAAMTSRGL